MNIIISGFSSRALVETAAEFECKIYSFDYFGDQDLEKYTADYFSIKNSPGSHYSIKVLFRMIKYFLRKNINKNFYFIYTSSWDNHPELLSELESLNNLTFAANNSDVINKLCSKKGLYDLFKVIKKTALKTPEIIFDKDIIKERLNKDEFLNSDKKFLLKPLKSGGGREIELIYSLKDYSRIKGKLINDNYYFEEYIDGELYSAQFGADTRNSKLISITKQLNALNTENAFQYGGNILIKADQQLRKILQETADLLTSIYGLKGINGFDFIIRNDEMYFLELNPRFTAAVELLLPIYSEDVFKIYFEKEIKKNYLHKYLNTDIKESGKIIYYAKSDLKVKDDLNKLNSKNIRDSIIESGQNNYFIKDLPQIGEKFLKGDPVFTLIIKADNEENFWKLTRKVFSQARRYFVIKKTCENKKG